MRRAMRAVYDKLLRDPEARRLWQEALGPCPQGEKRQPYEVAAPPPGKWREPPYDDWEPIWSFDHPNIHGGKTGAAVLTALGLQEPDHFQLTHNSSDIHCVIEHTHARLVAAFQKWLYEDCQAYDLDHYKVGLKRLFYEQPEVASPNVIFRDVKKLPELFEQVIEVKGGHPPKRFR